jgi:prevent-host-death family protein
MKISRNTAIFGQVAAEYDYGMMTMVKVGDAMKTMPAGKFKTNCLAIMDEVKAKREPVLITKHGKPVAILTPIEEKDDPIFGSLSHMVRITGDIVSPVFELDEWDVLK